jgi:hypothetical protein
LFFGSVSPFFFHCSVRQRVPARYPIRLYPDVSHGLKTMTPQPNWVLQFALTEAREVINPRVTEFISVYFLQAPYTVGFGTYSDGATDDVNKMLWSWLGLYNTPIAPLDFYMGYATCFLPEYDTKAIAQAMLLLEGNWANASQVRVVCVSVCVCVCPSW